MAQRKNRTGAYTIDQMLESQRFRIAVDYFKHDKSFMRAMLIEFLWETITVVRSKMCKVYAIHSGMNQADILGLMRNTTDFDTFNLWFSLSDTEQLLYLASPKHELTDGQRKELLDKLSSTLMGT